MSLCRECSQNINHQSHSEQIVDVKVLYQNQGFEAIIQILEEAFELLHKDNLFAYNDKLYNYLNIIKLMKILINTFRYLEAKHVFYFDAINNLMDNIFQIQNLNKIKFYLTMFDTPYIFDIFNEIDFSDLDEQNQQDEAKSKRTKSSHQSKLSHKSKAKKTQHSDDDLIYEDNHEDESIPIEVKISLLGEAGVGIDSIKLRYIKNEFDEMKSPILGASFSVKELTLDNEQKYILNIWNGSGKKQFRIMNLSLCKDADIVLLVYDITKGSSFDILKDFWVWAVKQNSTKDISK